MLKIITNLCKIIKILKIKSPHFAWHDHSLHARYVLISCMHFHSLIFEEINDNKVSAQWEGVLKNLGKSYPL